ncbi:MAG: efflux RND transporter permease subunit [Steroidobacteraceae bacterium]
MRISEISIRRPVFATVMSLLLLIFGLLSLQRLPLREYPDIEQPIVSIETRYPGAAAPVIETKVTQILEDRVAGIEGVDKIESSSEDERSLIRITFQIERDLDSAANDVRDRVARALAALPDESDPPVVSKADSNADAAVWLGLSLPGRSMLEITDYAERYVVDRLATVPGVARVSLSGARRPAMRIWLDRQALAARALTVTDIENALRRENAELPAGRLESRQREFALRTEVGLRTADDFRALVVGRGTDGHLVRLGDVADVRVGPEDERSIARINGVATVFLGIEAQSKANMLDLARRVRAETQAVQGTLPKGGRISVMIDNGVAIEAALREVIIALAFAFASVLLVIFVFLGSLRATLIPAVTIPVSIVASFMVMSALGYSVNVLTLLGLVLAIGLVVDDAIVVLENIHRRAMLQEPPLVAAVRGSREIGFAVVATTITLAAVFVPISFLPGDIGRLFREFGFTLAAAVVFSALVALTLTPMMASRLPSTGDHPQSRLARATDRLFTRLSDFYGRVLARALDHPWHVVAGVVALALAAVLTFRAVPAEFAPAADTGRVFMRLQTPEGSTLQYIDSYAARIEEIVLAERERHGDIRQVVTRAPGGSVNSSSSDVSQGRVAVMLTDWGDRDRSAAEISESLMSEVRKLPGIRVVAPPSSSLGRRSLSRPVQAVIGGPDYEQLAQWSDRILRLAEKNPMLVGPDSDYKERKPRMLVTVDRNRAADLGVSLATIGRTLETMLGSRNVTTYIDRGREYNVVLQARSDARTMPSDLSNIQVRSDRTGELIPLSNLVRLQDTSGALQLNRFDRLRSIKIEADLAPGATLGDAVRWFEETVARELPPSASLRFDGISRDYQRSSGQMYFTIALALGIVFLVLAAQFESFLLPGIVLVTVPLALAGAVFGLKLYGTTVNIFSQIAVVMLIGIAAKNGVLIVEFANQLRDRGVEFAEAILQAAVTRLRPVLMTSLCTAFGALPFLLATGAGSEQRRPIGIVVFYGTVVSVFLTLLAVPVVYRLVARNTRSPQHVSRLVDRLLGAAAPAADAPVSGVSVPGARDG